MKQVKCPSCGAPLSPNDNKTIKCDYCGSIFLVESPSQSELSQDDKEIMIDLK